MFRSPVGNGGQYYEPPSSSVSTKSFAYQDNGSAQNASGHNTYLHATLEEIDQLANQDVEMLAPISERATFLVVDTNILLHNFDVLAQLVEDVERLKLPLTVVVPGAVILELDGQKSRDGLAWFARRASTWLLEKIKERRNVKGQAREETCKASRNWRIRERGEVGGSMMFDSLIMDCCMYHAKHRRRTILCSGDKNLCIDASTQGIHSISPSQYWSSQELASQVFGEEIDLARFGRYKESYKDKLTPHHAEHGGKGYDVEEDMMMVDEVEGEPASGASAPPSAVIFKSEDPLNMLHEAIVDHFERLLSDLVGRLIEPEFRPKPTAGQIANMSRYDPRRRHYSEWSASECLEWLAQNLMKKSDGFDITTMIKNSRAGDFLKKPYRNIRGARPGKEWTKADWDKTMRHLQIIGEMYSEASILESLYHLELHVDHEFGLC